MSTAVPPTEPYVLWTDTHPETLRLYRMLPEFFRRADAEDTTHTDGYPLLRWLDLQVRWWGGATELMDRFNFPSTNTTSDLVDPYASDDEWLTWLGQLVAVSVTQTPGITTSSSWEFLRTFLDVNSSGTTEWWEWHGDSSSTANNGTYTWQTLQDANLAQRTQLTPVRDAINRRRSLADSYTTARSGYGYFDGSGPSIAMAIRAVLGGRQYAWVGNLAELKAIGPVHPQSVTTTGSTSEYFTFAKAVDLGKALVLPGTTSNYASSPDDSTLDITGDIEIVCRVALDDWTPAAETTLVSKRGASTQVSYRLYVTTAGVLTLEWSTNGTTITTQASSAPSLTDGAAYWLKATLDVVNSTNRVISFYKADDAAIEPSSWTTVSTHTVAGTTSIYSSTSPLEIGSYSAGASTRMTGRFYRAIVRSGIGGTTVFDADFTQQTEGVTSFTESTSKTVTINQGASQPKAQIYTGRTITMAMDRSTTTTTTNSSMTYGSNISVSQTTTAIVVTVGSGTATGTLPNGSRGTVKVTLDFNYPGNCKVTATHTPNGGSASTVINGTSVSHSISRPAGSTIITFGRGLAGTIYSATFYTTIALLTEFAVTDRYQNTGTAVASDATIWGNNGGLSMTFTYGSTPYSGTATVSPEWARIHVVTRASETPDTQVVLDAAETVRPAGFQIVLHTATEGP